ACLLSQLGHPFRHTLALDMPGWRRLLATITRVHLVTMAALVGSDGTGVIACDVLCGEERAVAEAMARVPRERLAEVLEARIESGALRAEPAPREIAGLLESSGLAERARVTQPWLWDLGATVQLVYGVLFTPPQG